VLNSCLGNPARVIVTCGSQNGTCLPRGLQVSKLVSLGRPERVWFMSETPYQHRALAYTTNKAHNVTCWEVKVGGSLTWDPSQHRTATAWATQAGPAAAEHPWWQHHRVHAGCMTGCWHGKAAVVDVEGGALTAPTQEPLPLRVSFQAGMSSFTPEELFLLSMGHTPSPGYAARMERSRPKPHLASHYSSRRRR
jgi:hypothetical protein